jgi:hypothetical protein
MPMNEHVTLRLSASDRATLMELEQLLHKSQSEILRMLLRDALTLAREQDMRPLAKSLPA